MLILLTAIIWAHFSTMVTMGTLVLSLPCIRAALIPNFTDTSSTKYCYLIYSQIQLPILIPESNPQCALSLNENYWCLENFNSRYDMTTIIIFSTCITYFTDSDTARKCWY